MAFQGYDIFPGLQVKGVVNVSVRELVVNFNLECLDALQAPLDSDLQWAEIAGVTPAVFEGKVPVDLTALDGFEPFEGTRNYKNVEIIALKSDVNEWQRNLRYPIRYDQTGNVTLQQIYSAATQGRSLIEHAKVMKPRLAATVFMQGTPSTAKALVYNGNSIPGAGLPLFSSAATTGGHFANPIDANSRKFDNYYTAVGAYSPTTFALTRANMRLVPSATLSAETLGLQVTDIIGPSHMEEPFRQVALANLYLQTQVISGTPVAAAPTNIYAAGSTPCTYWIAPQLDNDPYLAAYKAANPSWTAANLPHLWFAVSRKRPGMRCIEMVAPTKEFTPRITIFGDGSELAAQTKQVHINGDLDAGAAAGFPHVAARYEQT
jgi:hypothetical protein